MWSAYKRGLSCTTYCDRILSLLVLFYGTSHCLSHYNYAPVIFLSEADRCLCIKRHYILYESLHRIFAGGSLLCEPASHYARTNSLGNSMDRRMSVMEESIAGLKSFHYLEAHELKLPQNDPKHGQFVIAIHTYHGCTDSI